MTMRTIRLFVGSFGGEGSTWLNYPLREENGEKFSLCSCALSLGERTCNLEEAFQRLFGVGVVFIDSKH